MMDFNKTNSSDNSVPTVRFSFDDTTQASPWNVPQYFVDFLTSVGHDASVIAAIQTVIDTNNAP
jgi:hypothetical protein